MDTAALIGSIAQSAEAAPGTPARRDLEPRLARLRRAAEAAAQQSPAAASAALANVTLVAAQLLPRVKLSDSEREVLLQGICSALGARQPRAIHAAMADHLLRILASLVAARGFPDSTRQLAVDGWRRLVANVAAVQAGDRQVRTLAEYVREKAPRDYMSLVVCGLLDIAEEADSLELRILALGTLGDVLARKEWLGTRTRLEAIFPGTMSALARIALVQAPPSNPDFDSQKWRRPAPKVRTRSLQTMRLALLAMYGGEPTTFESPDAAPVRWAQLARGESAEEPVGPDEPPQVQRILWKVAGLRHVSELRAVLERLFATVSLDCARIPRACMAMGVEACLVLRPGEEYLRRLRASSVDVGQLTEAALAQFDEHVNGTLGERRLDTLRLVSGLARALGRRTARATMGTWWQTRGLSALVASLRVALSGTALVAVDSEPNAEECVLDNYRTPELRAALDLFISDMCEVLGPAAELCAQVLALPGAAASPGALWLLAKLAALSDGLRSSTVLRPMLQLGVDRLSSENSAMTEEPSAVLPRHMAMGVLAEVVPQLGARAAYFLDSLLFPLLQTLASTSPLLRVQADYTLKLLALNTGCAGVADMVRQNVDYIVDACSRQIRLLDVRPQTFAILGSAVGLAGSEILVFMDDVVEDTLDLCEMGERDEDTATAALHFLEAVTRTIADSHGPSLPQVACVGWREEDPIVAVIREMDDADAQQQMDQMVSASMSFDAPEPETQVAVEEPGDEDQEVGGSPLAIKIALAVHNFLMSDSPAQQLVALKTVKNALAALQSTRDLLPLVNEVWPPLVRRITEGEREAHYVVLAACDVVESVCVLGSDWMRKRIKDDLWGRVRQLLTSLQATRGALEQRSGMNLATAVLHAMQRVVEYVPLDDPTAWDLAALAFGFYGTPAEPLAADLLRAMAPAYGDKVWLQASVLSGQVAAPNIGVSCSKKASVPADICQTLGV
ncbi:hypothetical protein GGF46_003399 [Coemansia sp. RSA 552]|nr:hypothetical protein GGF46_003399 [Coemansia sp. RSA 552]